MDLVQFNKHLQHLLSAKNSSRNWRMTKGKAVVFALKIFILEEKIHNT